MAWKSWLLIEPIDGGQQQVESTMNFLMWKRVLGGDKNPIDDQRESYGGRVWRIVGEADEAKDLTLNTVSPLIPTSLPIPILPPEARRDVIPALMPNLPELDPSGAPVSQPDAVVEKNKAGRPKKVTA